MPSPVGQARAHLWCSSEPSAPRVEFLKPWFSLCCRGSSTENPPPTDTGVAQEGLCQQPAPARGWRCHEMSPFPPPWVAVTPTATSCPSKTEGSLEQPHAPHLGPVHTTQCSSCPFSFIPTVQRAPFHLSISCIIHPTPPAYNATRSHQWHHPRARRPHRPPPSTAVGGTISCSKSQKRFGMGQNGNDNIFQISP